MLKCEAVEPDGKSCSKCGEYKTLASFYAKRGRKTAECKPCHGIRTSLAYRRNRDQRLKGVSDRSLERDYGITRTIWEAMWAAQDGLCRLCDRALSLGTGGHATDHDHSSGRVRALLCGACNRGLGLFHDNADVMRRAAAYVEFHRVGS